jgi:DNA-binding XRE family transcriptional regulator
MPGDGRLSPFSELYAERAAMTQHRYASAPLSAAAFRRRTSHPIPLAEVRTTLGLSQLDLAERSGVSKTTIVLIEASRTYAMPGTRRKIADACSLRVEAIAWPTPTLEPQPA